MSVHMNDIYLLRMPEISVNVSLAFTMTDILQNPNLFCRYICNCSALIVHATLPVYSSAKSHQGDIMGSEACNVQRDSEELGLLCFQI